MSDKDILNWSADLRRIAWWLQIGNNTLAKKFIERGRRLYPKGKKIANRNWEWWMSEINRRDHLKATERALTWSILLK